MFKGKEHPKRIKCDFFVRTFLEQAPRHITPLKKLRSASPHICIFNCFRQLLKTDEFLAKFNIQPEVIVLLEVGKDDHQAFEKLSYKRYFQEYGDRGIMLLSHKDIEPVPLMNNSLAQITKFSVRSIPIVAVHNTSLSKSDIEQMRQLHSTSMFVGDFNLELDGLVSVPTSRSSNRTIDQVFGRTEAVANVTTFPVIFSDHSMIFIQLM